MTLAEDSFKGKDTAGPLLQQCSEPVDKRTYTLQIYFLGRLKAPTVIKAVRAAFQTSYYLLSGHPQRIKLNRHCGHLSQA